MTSDTIPTDVDALAEKAALNWYGDPGAGRTASVLKMKQRFVEVILADRSTRPDRIREDAAELLNCAGPLGPPEPLLYPNAEWCEAYAAWHHKAMRFALRATQPEAPQDARHEKLAGKGQQRTICHECGQSNLAAAKAVWTDDGSSFCPDGCAPQDTRKTVEDGEPHCIACGHRVVAGDRYYPDADGGVIHAECCGPEREAYTGSDGEPLRDGEPIPTPSIWAGLVVNTREGT